MSLIQMAEMSCSDLLREATRMYLLTLCVCAHVLELVLRGVLLTVCGSIYTVHDEVKDKDFELELSWVGEGKLTPPLHTVVTCHLPQPLEDSIRWCLMRSRRVPLTMPRYVMVT